MKQQVTSLSVKKIARDCGFDLCGIASPDILPESRRRYFEWIAKGYHGEMSYLSRDTERRTDPRRSLPEAKSIIMLGLNYYTPNLPATPKNSGHISRYARGRDYHKVILSGIKRMVRTLHDVCDISPEIAFRSYVDFGPLSERSYAEAAGLGFIGKNGMLINRKYGSWVFLAAILTSLELESDTRHPIEHGHCGDCRKCIEACPTDAIVSPRTIDSTRCVSYLTVERPSSIPTDLASRMGSMIFGCDICQEVCPYNERPVQTLHDQLAPDSGVGEFLNLNEVLSIRSREAFLELTAGTPLTRAKLSGLGRSASIARENLKARNCAGLRSE